MKRYGDTKTSLTLTEKAALVYANTDPIGIYENEDGTYDVDGALGAWFDLSEDEVNEILEDAA